MSDGLEELDPKDAARELSNPEGRRGYRRTAALAAVVAARIGELVDHAKTDVEIASTTLEDLERIGALARAMAGLP